MTYGSRSTRTPTLERSSDVEALDRRPVEAAYLVGDLLEADQRAVEGQRQQRFLALDVVVDGGLADAEPPRQVLDAGAVEAALVEHRDRGGQHRLEVVTGPSPASRVGGLAVGTVGLRGPSI